MAYQVDFGIINKKVNSTSEGFTVNFSATCNLKIPCDVMQPVFLVQGAFPPTDNYFHVADFGRYYWITGIRFNSGQWEITGITDVLASFKYEIGNQLQYIVRTSNVSLRNEEIIDSMALAGVRPTITYLSDTLGLNATGCFVVCCAGKNGNKYFMMDSGNWQALYAKVYTSGFLNDNYNVWQAITQDFCNTVLNPQDYIINAKWLPCGITGNAESISLGFTDTGVVGYSVTPGMAVFTRNISWAIPLHPQYATYGQFLNGNMFRKITLALPGYGNLVLDADALATDATLNIVAEMDITGVLTYSIDYAGKHTYVCCDLSADAGYSVTKSSIGNALANAGEAAGVGAAGGGVIGAVGMVAVNGILSAIPQVERASSGGSRSVLAGGGLIKCTIMYYTIQEFSGVKVGYACCRTLTPATCGGYIECKNASVQCTGTEDEINKINNYMNGGFYYE